MRNKNLSTQKNYASSNNDCRTDIVLKGQIIREQKFFKAQQIIIHEEKRNI